jgi:hypothetical protein
LRRLINVNFWRQNKKIKIDKICNSFVIIHHAASLMNYKRLSVELHAKSCKTYLQIFQIYHIGNLNFQISVNLIYLFQI